MLDSLSVRLFLLHEPTAYGADRRHVVAHRRVAAIRAVIVSVTAGRRAQHRQLTVFPRELPISDVSAAEARSGQRFVLLVLNVLEFAV